MKRLTWVYDDGGREAAGFKGYANDCVTRAIAIAMRRDYREVYDEINELGATEKLVGRRQKARPAHRRRSAARTGVYGKHTRELIRRHGWIWTPTMQIGSGCRVHLRADELPHDRLIGKVSQHVVAVMYGELRDLDDCSRDGTRCVYGYWRPPR